MKYSINVFCDVLAIMRISHITTHYLDIGETVNIFKPTPIVKGIILR